MATAKKSAKKPAETTTDVAVVDKPKGELMSYKDRMAALVATTKKAESPSGGYISLKQGRMKVGDVPMPNDMIRAIVVEYRKDNEFYPKAYVQGESQFPTCHAVVRPHEVLSPWRKPRPGEDTSKLKSDKATGLVADCEKPEVEAGRGCDSCRMLEWKSASLIENYRGSGKGKACRESRRLHVLAADQCTTPGDVEKAPFMTLIPPPTSLDNFKRFANEVTEVLDTPIFGAVVEIAVKPHDDFQFMVHYKIIEQINDEGILLALLNRHEQMAQKQMSLPKADDSKEAKDARGGKF